MQVTGVAADAVAVAASVHRMAAVVPLARSSGSGQAVGFA